MPPVIPPRAVVAQQAKSATIVPTVTAAQTAPLTKTAVTTAKAVSIDKRTLVTIEQSGSDADPTYRVKSHKGTLLYAGKNYTHLEAWIQNASLDTLSS